MQTVHILRTKQKLVRSNRFLKISQRQVRRIRLSLARRSATIRVVLPNQRRIALPGLDIRQVIMAVSAPLSPLKHWNSALGADPRSGQDKHVVTPFYLQQDLFLEL